MTIMNAIKKFFTTPSPSVHYLACFNADQIKQVPEEEIDRITEWGHPVIKVSQYPDRIVLANARGEQEAILEIPICSES